LSQVVVYAKGGFKHQSNEVRSQSFHVLLECYKTLGREAIKAHLAGLRVAQLEMLEKGFSKIDEERGLLFSKAGPMRQRLKSPVQNFDQQSPHERTNNSF